MAASYAGVLGAVLALALLANRDSRELVGGEKVGTKFELEPVVAFCCTGTLLLGVAEKKPRRGGVPFRGFVSCGGDRRTFFLGVPMTSVVSVGALDEVEEDMVTYVADCLSSFSAILTANGKRGIRRAGNLSVTGHSSIEVSRLVSIEVSLRSTSVPSRSFYLSTRHGFRTSGKGLVGACCVESFYGSSTKHNTRYHEAETGATAACNTPGLEAFEPISVLLTFF